MQAAGVLGKGAAPGDGQGQEQRVESRIVEAFPDVSTGCDQQTFFCIAGFGKPLHGIPSFGRFHASVQDNDVASKGGQPLPQVQGMLSAFGQYQGGAPGLKGDQDIVEDHVVPGLVLGQGGVNLLDGQFSIHHSWRWREAGAAEFHPVEERLARGWCAGIGAKAYWSALHEDDGMVAILSRDCRRQAEHVAGFAALCKRLEADSCQMVAFIEDNLPVVRDEVVHLASPYETLDDRDINPAAWVSLPAPDPADIVMWEV